MKATRSRDHAGFTLIELLVVIIIIVILAGVTIALMGSFFRGQGVRQGASIVSQAIAEAKQAAAKSHRVHFLVFSKVKTEGWMEIHIANVLNTTGIYNGDQDSSTDRPPQARVVRLCPGVDRVHPFGVLLFQQRVQ